MSNIFLGRFVKAFGIRGELKFHPSDDFWEEVLQSRRLVGQWSKNNSTEERPLVLDRTRSHGNNFVVKLKGVDDRNAAEGLVGGEVFVAEEQLDIALPERLLPYQVVGMTVRNEKGDVLGEVASVIYSSAHDVYEVKGLENDFLLPAVPEFVVSVDMERREITITPIPGLCGD